MAPQKGVFLSPSPISHMPEGRAGGSGAGRGPPHPLAPSPTRGSPRLPTPMNAPLPLHTYSPEPRPGPRLPTPTRSGGLWGASHSASPLGEEGGGGRKSERKKRAPRKGPASQQSPFQTKGGCGELRGEPGLGIPPRPGSAVRLPFAAAASPSSSSAAAAASPTRAAVSTVAAAASTTTAAASAAAAASDSTRQGGHLSPPSLPAQPLRSAAAANSLRPLPPLLVAEGEGRRGGRAGSPRRRLLQIKNAGWVASPLPAPRLRLARPPHLPLPPPPSRSPALPPPPQLSLALAAAPPAQCKSKYCHTIWRLRRRQTPRDLRPLLRRRL